MDASEYIDSQDSTDTSMENMTFEEILSNLLVSDELVLTIPGDDVERVKIGLKNLKSKRNKKLREDGLVPDNATLEFSISPSETEDFIDLRIFHIKKGTVSVKKMIVPSGEF